MTRKHLEGVMAKEIDSLYYPNRRSRVWLKIKQHQTGDCIIIGYTQERRSLSALLLAVYDGKKLVYIGRVGTGFNSENTPEILRKLKKLQRAKPPKGIENEDGVTWVSPQQVCEVKYAEVTRGGMLRAPVFTHLRTDKPAKDCDTKQFVRFG